MSHTILGKDAYWMNMWGLMALTAIEVGAVGLDLSRSTTLWILVSIGIPKFLMIAGIFMHLTGEQDSRVLTLTALFPSAFILVMVIFIGLTHPDATTALPDIFRPGYWGL